MSAALLLIDGVYLDGTSEPWGCRNLQHGCGYERADGSPGKTYPFFAVRQLMKRIYTVVKSRKPDGLVNVHQSTCMATPNTRPQQSAHISFGTLRVVDRDTEGLAVGEK